MVWCRITYRGLTPMLTLDAHNVRGTGMSTVLLSSQAIMTDQSRNLTLFNPATMSGVLPGTRTKVFQRLRLLPHSTNERTTKPVADSAPSVPAQWAQLLWYDDPAVCRLYLLQDTNQTISESPLFELERSALTNAQLHRSLGEAGWQANMCGNCCFWSARDAQNDEGLTFGDCTWGTSASDKRLVGAHLRQSFLHWAVRSGNWPMCVRPQAK